MIFSNKALVFATLMSLGMHSTSGQTTSPIEDRTIRRAVSLWFEDQPSAIEKYGHIRDWNTSQVTDMSQLFNSFEYPSAAIFNENITGWDTSQVTSMNLMFNGAREFNQDISSFDVSKVSDMNFLFFAAASFNQDISSWDTSRVQTMSFTFSGAKEFDQDIGQWNMSSLTNMAGIFFGAEKFNHPIGNWDVSLVTTMSSAFYGATSFNQNIGRWNTSKLVNLGMTFFRATSFNQPMNEWDVSNVEDMNGAFSKATSFNQMLDMWNVSSCTDMQSMFFDSTSFDQVLCWDLNQIDRVDDMFCGSLGSFDEACVDSNYIASSIESCSTNAPTKTPLPTAAPSPAPSQVPSSSPVSQDQSTSPTGSITSEPTVFESPIAAPTNPPTTNPPTKLPTIIPSLSPTMVPSSTPSISFVPSAKFVLSMTPSISASPSSMPIIQESLEPSVTNNTASDDLCTTNSNGDFGLTSQGNSNQVDFYYQMKTTPNISISDANTIVKDNEVSINNILLPILFARECSISSRLEQKRTRRLSWVGVQAAPADNILTDVECNGVANNDENSCFVVAGGLTLITLSDSDIAETDNIKNSIKTDVNNGSLNRITEEGVELTIEYRDASSILKTTDNSTKGTTSDDGDEGSDNLWVWITAFACTGLILGLAAVLGTFLLRRRTASKLEDESYAEASWHGNGGAFPNTHDGATPMSVEEVIIQEPEDSGYSYREESLTHESVE